MQHLGVFIVSVSGVSGLVGPGWKLGRAPVVRRDDGSSCVRSVEASGLDVDMSVPLSSFAAEIDGEVIRRFGEAETERVRASWKLMDLEYVHKEQFIPGHEYMKQEARSYLPGLTPIPFWNLEESSWAKTLEANWEVVRDEFTNVAMKDAKRLKKRGTGWHKGASLSRLNWESFEPDHHERRTNEPP